MLQQHSQNFQVVVEAYSSSLSTACAHILAMDQRVNGIIALSCPAVFNSKAQSPSKDLHQQFISHVWLFWTFGNLKSFSYLDKFSKPGHLKTSEFCMQSQVTLTKKYKIDFVSCPACGSLYCLVAVTILSKSSQQKDSIVLQHIRTYICRIHSSENAIAIAINDRLPNANQILF